MRSAAALHSKVPRYTIGVCKGSALLEETKALLRAWKPAESLREFRDRVLREDLLGKPTAYRVNDIVRRFFAPRFLVAEGRPAVFLKALLRGRNGGQLFPALCLLYAARQDELLRDIIVELYWPAVAEGRLTLGIRDVVMFLRQAEEDGRIPARWSEQVKLRVGRGILRALVDFALLKEVRRGRRETVVYRPNDGAVVYLAHDLHFAGATDGAMVRHRDWALFGLREQDVVATMHRLGSDRWWVVQAAGSVVRITWRYESMQEVVDALAG